MQELTSKFWSFNRSSDIDLIKTEEIMWEGPFAWYRFEQINTLKPIPDVAGVYLHTFDYKDGYILRSAGATSSTKRRLAEHTREYMNGKYTVLDVESAKIGRRKELWHGWKYAKAHRDEFIEHKDFIIKSVEKELAAYRLFVAQVGDKRKRERIEFAIMHSVYSSKEPWSDLVDGGMALRGRYNNEVPIEVKNTGPCKIYGLPETLEV
jgi:hypothetical protein